MEEHVTACVGTSRRECCIHRAEICLIYMAVHLCNFIYLLVLLLFLQSFHSFRCNAPLATAPKRAGHLNASGRALVPRPARL